MGSKVAVSALWLLLIGLAYGVEIYMFHGSWKPEFGWHMNCMWGVSKKLQSVRLYKDEVQFLVFRPEEQGPNITSNFILPPNDTRMTVNCYERGRRGDCYIGLELLSAPILDAKYKCEASEEVPIFDISKLESGTAPSRFPASKNTVEYLQEWFVAPSFPQLEVSSVERVTVVNCTAAGIPAPRLTWRIGEQKIPENFSNRTWDFKTKLWHSWSVVSVLRDENQVLYCTATVTKPGRTAEEKTIRKYLESKYH